MSKKLITSTHKLHYKLSVTLKKFKNRLFLNRFSAVYKFFAVSYGQRLPVDGIHDHRACLPGYQPIWVVSDSQTK